MRRFASGLISLCFAATVALPALADAIPYPNPGTIAPQVTTYADSSSGIDIYFFGSGAAFNDYVEVQDVKTGYDSGQILENHTTALGAELVVGATPGQINAGDQLIFYIDSPQGKFASIAADSADGVNHAYITTYSGGTLAGVTIPSGLYVGLEDEANGGSDFNYTDDTFVFAGVATTVTPEPSSLLLLATGLLSAGRIVMRRRQMDAHAC